MSGLEDKYRAEVAPALREKRGYANPMQTPRLRKVVVNMGFGVMDKDAMKSCVEQLARVTGQKPGLTRARKSISNFKLRAGMTIGARVTLRGKRMFDFLERLIHAALPRIRDFRGVSDKGFDGKGNFTTGIREQTIFPEIDPNEVVQVQGMDVTIVTSAKTDAEARDLLTLLGMPFAGK